MDSTVEVKADAKSRALRTFAVGLGTDVLAAVLISLAPLILSDDLAWDKAWWVLLVGLALRTTAQSAFSYLFRLVVAPGSVGVVDPTN